MIKELMSKVLGIFTRNNYILLESESDFCDSTKAIYDYMVRNELNNKFKIFWCVNNVEYFKNLYKLKNVSFINKRNLGIKEYILFTISKYAIYTHQYVGNRHNKSQIRVFVTHASMPIKNSAGWFGNDPSMHSYILGVSKECIQYRKKVLGDSDNYAITGLPRNDDLFLKGNEYIHKITKGMRYIVWFPTFKHHENSDRNDFGIEIKNDISLLTPENIELINQVCCQNNLLLVIKPHPSQDMRFLSNINTTNVITVTNDCFLGNEANIYNLLGESDALITDFSSVYVDYLLIDKPIGFELTDQEKYKNGIGYVMDNPDDFMPGEKIIGVKEFTEFISHVGNGIDPYKNERNKLCSRLHDFKDDLSSERVLKLLGII